MRYKIALLLLSTNVLASPIKHEYQHFYPISGNTAQELRQQLDTLGPMDKGKRYDAYTAWHIQWRYKYRDTQDGCKLEKVRVNLDINYTFPEWKNYADANTELKDRWDKYIVSLRRHESTHAENGEDAAGEIEYLLNNFPAMASCQTLESMANRRAQQIISQTNEKDIAYDQSTHHGITQGAIFP